jgi:uncharacterized protein
MDRGRNVTAAVGYRAACLVAWIGLIVFPSIASAELDIPPVPEDNSYILDRANVVSMDAADNIGDIQRRADQQHDTQLVVVTIDSKAEYGGRGMAIEQFAREWFDQWGIGIRRDGQLYNRGILLLVSVGDRKARIELGAEWGHRWDGYARRVMDQQLVPAFKSENYSLGIIRGVDALSKMAQRGPEANPPDTNVVDRWMRDASRWTEVTSIFSPRTQAGLVLLGLVLIVLSFFVEDRTGRRWLFWGGVGLIVAALLTWVVMAIIAIFFNDESEGYSGGGGSFGGGFSGGGGATGSW